MKSDPYWNPYIAGFVLGLVLLLAYASMGFGVGSSSGPLRVVFVGMHEVAPAWAEGHAYLGSYFGEDVNILQDWMVFEVFGLFLGGIVAAYSAGRMKMGAMDMGPNSTVRMRIILAISGGMLMGLGARLARGCTSGQALTGGAVLSAGAWAFMVAMFIGGYLMAPVVRRQWR